VEAVAKKGSLFFSSEKGSFFSENGRGVARDILGERLKSKGKKGTQLKERRGKNLV
jgi:hypothetical protein